jgi:hypothetical protein
MGKELRPKIAQAHPAQGRHPATVSQAIAMNDIGDFLDPALMGLKRRAAHLREIPVREPDHSGKTEDQKQEGVKSAALHSFMSLSFGRVKNN